MSLNRKPHRLAVFAWAYLLIGYAYAAELSFKLDQPHAVIMDDELWVQAPLTNAGPGDAFKVEITALDLEGAKRISPPLMPLVFRGGGDMPARGRFRMIGGTFELAGLAPGKRAFTVKGDAMDTAGKVHQFSFVVDVVVPDPNAKASIRDPGEQKKEKIFLKARASVELRPGVWEYTIRNDSEFNVIIFDLQEFSVPTSAIAVRRPQGWEVHVFDDEIAFIANGKGIPPGQSLGGFELSVPAASKSVNVIYTLSGIAEQAMEKMEKKQLTDEQLKKLGMDKNSGGAYFGMIEGPGY